jgi:hypothetical protein
MPKEMSSTEQTGKWNRQEQHLVLAPCCIKENTPLNSYLIQREMASHKTGILNNSSV